MEHSNNHSELETKIKALVNSALKDIIPGMLEGWRQEIHIMRQAVNKNDYEAVRKISHKMKGTGGMFGLAGITEMGGGLETAAINMNKEGMEKNLRMLTSYVKEVRLSFNRQREKDRANSFGNDPNPNNLEE